MVSTRRTAENSGISLRAAAAQRRRQRQQRATQGNSSTSSSSVPGMLQEMLAEAGVTSSRLAARSDAGEPPPKRLKRPGERRAAADRQRASQTDSQKDSQKESQQTTQTDEDGEEEDDEDIEFEDIVIPKPVIQTTEMGSEDEYEDGGDDDDDDDDDDDEDLVFEDVRLASGPEKHNDNADNNDEPLQEQQPQTLELNLTEEQNLRTPTRRGKSAAAARRKPLTRAERLRRVDVHKVHLLCLLSHVAQRNRWCNLDAVRTALRPLLTQKMITYLNPGSHLTQFGRTESLKNGLQQVSTMFKTKFAITERGMRRALWAEDLEQLKDYELPKDMESTLDKDDFVEAARTLQGSRDVGAQLFCALLRVAGVETRLVCSLQPLSFLTSAPTLPKPRPAKTAPSIKAKAAAPLPKIYQSTTTPDESAETIDLTTASPRRRLGHPQAAAYHLPSSRTPPPPPPPPRRQLQASASGLSHAHVVRGESHFPVYWVEVLDVAHQKWQPVDPLVTCSQWRPAKLEPPASDRSNQLSYVVAFGDNGTAKDVTRRYAKAYNAKTRRARVDGLAGSNTTTWTPTSTTATLGAAPSTSTKRHRPPLTNDRWLRRALRHYRRHQTQYGVSDLDQIEDTELAHLEAREPMPRNVADFQNHPVYALARHLRRHEVLVPQATSVGTVSAGSRAPLERIYRRKDVRIAYSADKWYRLGQIVVPNEIPAKWLPQPKPKLAAARRRRGGFAGDADDEADTTPAGEDDLFGDDAVSAEHAARYGLTFEPAGTPLFTPEQTELYQAPPVVHGRVPKNKFGNIDVYVPSMVPAGGVHIIDDGAARAAFLLGIDYAPALTGFRFEGRQGTAVLRGAVVAAEHEEAVRAVLAGLADQEAEAEAARRTRVALRVWTAFLRGLRIRHRIRMAAEDRGEAVDDEEEGDEEETAAAEQEQRQRAGMEPAVRVSPAKAKRSKGKGRIAALPRRPVPHNLEDDDDDSSDEGGGFVPDENDQGGGFVPEEDGGGLVREKADAAFGNNNNNNNNNSSSSSSSIHDFDDDNGGGGFIPEDGDPTATHDEDQAGGFLPEDNSNPTPEDIDERGGGFIPEDGAAAAANDQDYENAMADAQSDVTEEYDMVMDDDDDTGGGFLLE